MEENSKTYRKKINNYLDEVEYRITDALKFYISQSYDKDVKFIYLMLHPEGFVTTFEVYPTLMYDGLVADNNIASHFEKITPVLEKELDPYNVDYHYRPRDFNQLLNERFSLCLKKAKKSLNQKPVIQIIMSVLGEEEKAWHVNKSKYVNIYNIV